MIGKLIEVVWSGVGAVSGFVTKLVSFGTAYVSEVLGANKTVTDTTRNVGEKIGDVITETGYKAGQIAGKAWDVTADAVTGVACAVADGARDILEDEEKSRKAKKAGVAVGITGAALLAIGATIYCITKRRND